MSGTELMMMAFGIALVGGTIWLAMRHSRRGVEQLARDSARWDEGLETLARERGLRFAKGGSTEHPLMGPIAYPGHVRGSVDGFDVAITVHPGTEDHHRRGTLVALALRGSAHADASMLEQLVGTRFPASVKPRVRELEAGGASLRRIEDVLQLWLAEATADPALLGSRLDLLRDLAREIAAHEREA